MYPIENHRDDFEDAVVVYASRLNSNLSTLALQASRLDLILRWEYGFHSYVDMQSAVFSHVSDRCQVRLYLLVQCSSTAIVSYQSLTFVIMPAPPQR